jgi:hypothetical protein
MPKPIPINFDANFDGTIAAHHVGRIQIGANIARILFCPDGVLRIAVDVHAKTDGSIIWTDDSRVNLQTVGFSDEN